jgi:hypothetical protein
VNGSQHYQEGERLLSNASFIGADGPVQRDGSRFEPGEHCALVDRAMAHFAAAQVAATALRAVLPLVGGDSAEITEWARAIGAFDDSAVPEAVIEPASWPPITGDAWAVKGVGSWVSYAWFAQHTPDGLRMVPSYVGEDIDAYDALTPEELLKAGELKLLYRNPEEPPF